MKNNKEEFSRRIINYLMTNPDGGDTLEGISRWWLELERIDRCVDEVAGALDMLLEKGILRKTTLKDGTVFFKMGKGVIQQTSVSKKAGVR